MARRPDLEVFARQHNIRMGTIADLIRYRLEKERNVERIAEAIRNSMTHADIIITTGGLGPTVDDPTREAVARAFGVEIEFRQELWEQILEVVAHGWREPKTPGLCAQGRHRHKKQRWHCALFHHDERTQRCDFSPGGAQGDGTRSARIRHPISTKSL